MCLRSTPTFGWWCWWCDVCLPLVTQVNGIIEGNEFEKSAPASKTDSRMWVLDMDGHGCHYEYYEWSQYYLL